jgi:hypothetical protein
MTKQTTNPVANDVEVNKYVYLSLAHRHCSVYKHSEVPEYIFHADTLDIFIKQVLKEINKPK